MKKKENLNINQNELIENKKENKKNWLVSGIVTVLLIIMIFDIYILSNIALNNIILPEFDFTENKVYTLSEITKSKIKNILINFFISHLLYILIRHLVV